MKVWNSGNATAYVEEAAGKQVPTEPASGKEAPDSAAGYGYWVWQCARDGAYRAEGIYGQFIIVLPGQDAVITIAAHKEGTTQPILDAVWDTVIPQLG